MEASKEEQRGVVRFFTTEGVEGREICRRMSNVYDVHSMPCSCVLEYQKSFGEGRVSLQGNAQSPQQSLYSPDFSLCDFHIFGELEKFMDIVLHRTKTKTCVTG